MEKNFRKKTDIYVCITESLCRTPETKTILYINYVCVCAQSLSCVRLFATPWTVDHQVPLSMGFPRQEYWSRFLFPPPGDLPDPGIKPAVLVSPALTSGFFTTESPGKPHITLDLKPKGSESIMLCCSAAKLCLTLQPHRLQHARLPCSSPSPRVCSNSHPSSQ